MISMHMFVLFEKPLFAVLVGPCVRIVNKNQYLFAVVMGPCGLFCRALRADRFFSPKDQNVIFRRTFLEFD